MKHIKILAVMAVIVYISATDQNVFENGDPIMDYIKGSLKVVDEFEARLNISEKYQRKVPTSGRYTRASRNSNLSETLKQKEPSKPYYFDYLVKDPTSNSDTLQFHVQEKHENGTVKGVYGLSDFYLGYILVRYVADAKGYRAEVTKGERVVTGLRATRDHGRIVFGAWKIMGVESPALQLYTPGKTTKSDYNDYDE